ncbi:hypothetical protein AVEN_91977-1, partial [Araneus ventricosus]
LESRHDCPVCNSCSDVAISGRTSTYFTRSLSDCFHTAFHCLDVTGKVTNMRKKERTFFYSSCFG